MPKTSQPVALLRKRYNDFDQFTDEVRAWDLHFEQLETGPFRGGMTQLATPEFHLTRARFRRRLHQTGLPPAGLKTFGIPAHPNMNMFWRGKYLTGNDMVSFPMGGELDCVSESDFDIFTVSLPAHVLAEAADRIGGASAQKQLLNEEVRRCEAATMRFLRGHLAKLQRSLAETRTQTKLAASLPSQELGQLIANAWLGGNGNRWKEPRRSRSQVISAVLEHIHRSSPDPLTVADLCQTAGASERTLEYAFRERFGISPKRYLKAHQLTNVRRDLRVADPGQAKVVDIANHWGFWHMGQFAADYRRQFGELPSKTLNC